MYNRDSFFSVVSSYNEATIQFLIWGMLNKRRFGATLPKEKIDKAVAYVLNEFDKDCDGICKSHFSLSQVDIIDYQPKTDRLAVNQGMFTIALKTIKELGYDITDAYIEKAEVGCGLNMLPMQLENDMVGKRQKHLWKTGLGLK